MKMGKVVWSDALLDNGARKTQAEWTAWCKEDGYRLPTQAEYVAAVRSLLKQPDSEFKTSFFSDLRRYYLMTSETLPCLDGFERALVLGVLNDWFYILAYVGVNVNWPARGVVVTKKTSKRNKGGKQ